MTPASFGVHHPVPANLLMFLIIVVGIVMGLSLRREFFPEIRPNQAMITAPYPGASPQEIVDGLILKIEDQIADLEDVQEISASINEGVGVVVVEFRRDIDSIIESVDEVKAAIDTLQDLPDDAEEIRTAKFVPTMPVISVSVCGDLPEEDLKRAVREMKDDLRLLPGMGNVIISGFRRDEIRVEIRPETLLEYGLSLPQISNQVREWMHEVPGGTVRSAQQTVRVRTLGVEERAETIRNIVVKSDEQGGVVRLGDIARVYEGLADQDLMTRLNGRPSVSLIVLNVGDGDAVAIAELVRAYVVGRREAKGQDGPGFESRAIDRWYAFRNRSAQASYEKQRQKYDEKTAQDKNGSLRPVPPTPKKSPRLEAYELGLSRTNALAADVIAHNDLARFIEGRLDLLMRNAKWGALFVFLTLLVFLNVRVALWVMLGLVVSLLGTLAFMSMVGITLNLLTMFGLIVVLGLLVDDAIVVAENITARYEEGEPALAAAINGAGQVAWPVVATVCTTIAAFLPLRMIEGQMGDFLGALPIVVACALSVSLIEALIILPAHMGHSLAARSRLRFPTISGPWRRYEKKRDAIIQDVIIPAFGEFLRQVLHYRYVATAFALATWIVSMAMVAGGRVEFTFFPSSDSEIFIVDLKMPIGTSIEKTDAMVRKVEAACLNQPEILTVETFVGNRLDTNDWSPAGARSNIAQLYVECQSVEIRDIPSSEIIRRIREEVGDLVGIHSLRFEEIQGGPGGPGINLVVTGEDDDQMFDVIRELKNELARFEGINDITDNADRAQRELQIRLYDGAAGLGLSSASLADQIRASVYGFEPHTFAANQEDVDVRVTLDRETRRSLADIENLYIFTDRGVRVPLREVASVTEGIGYAAIHRLNRQQAVTVTAYVDQAVNNPEMIVASMRPFMADLAVRFPEVGVEARGRQLETSRSLRGIKFGFMIACILIYVILAWLFGSYFQPIAVMVAIPFAMIGVIWGHWIMGFEMMILSLIGFVALTGIVVNDSLIYIQFYNHKRKEGLPIVEALVESGRRRLRPIVLTTLTTVLGLCPLMLEQSFQAKFLIPMAISIAFGLMGATVLILVALPCFILIGDDLKHAAAWLWSGGASKEGFEGESEAPEGGG